MSARLARLWSAAAIASLVALPVAAAQNAGSVSQAGSARGDPITKKVLTADDYSRWRSIEGQRISSAGRWVAWVYRHTNVLPADSKPELHILNLPTKQDVVVANASNPVFSPDGKWIAYQVDSQPPRNGRGQRGGGFGAQPGSGAPGAQPPNGRGGLEAGPLRRTELRELATGKTQTWRDMQSVVFAENSKFVLLRRRPAVGGGRGGRGGAPGGAFPGGRGGASEPVTEGSDAVLHDLTTGRSQFIGSVGDAAFNRSGDLLAYVVDATIRDGNGLFVTDLATGSTRALDNDARIYDRLAWNEAGTGLAVLKGKEVDKMRDRDNALVVIPDVHAAIATPGSAPATLTASAAQFPADWVISDRAPLAWSEDGARVFFGTMPQSPALDTTRRRSTDSIADVDVWRTSDRYIQSVQMIRAEQDRDFTYRQAFDVAASKYVPLTDSTMRDIQISPDGRWGVGRDIRPYISDYKPAAADLFRVNTATGERTPIIKDQFTQGTVFGISPDGHKFVYWADARFHAYDLDAGTSATLGSDAPSFVNAEFDHPGPRPPYGVAGFTSDGKGVIVEGKYDLWLLPLDGGAPARNLTLGAGQKNRTIFRIARVAPIDSSAPRRVRTGQEIDLSKPVTLSAFGELTKKDGFYRLDNGKLTEIVYEDAAFGTPVRAANAEEYLFTRETFAEFPDLRVSGGDFKTAEKITDANPQQAEYRWGHRVLFDFSDRDGHKLQGMMALPDDYKPGEKRPMIVNFYEKNTQNLNRYSPPSFLTGMGSSPIEGASRGYIMMVPDVYYHTGSSHTDQLDAVENATRKVIAMGYADPKHIGLNGHSYGGEGAAFIATRSRLFAAVGVGAGVTDLFTDFSQEWGWSYQVSGGSGANGNEYYLYGQGRWGFSPWDKPELYHSESALTHVPEVTEPILIMHGTADPTVSFIEGLNFYNALRFNGKNAVLLAYPGEGHGLRGLANRRDLTIRYFQFFDHYLKGAPAPKWMTDGVPFLRKDELKDPGPDVP